MFIKLEDIRYIREFQNNDSIPLKKLRCPHGTLLSTGYDEEDNVIMFCTCCNLKMHMSGVTFSIMKDAVEKYVINSEELH